MYWNRKHVLVCTANHCMQKGAQRVAGVLRIQLKREGLDTDVLVNTCDSIDLCDIGPNIVVYPDGIIYSSVGVKDIPEIIESLREGGQPVERLVLTPGTGDEERRREFYAEVILSESISPEAFSQMAEHHGFDESWVNEQARRGFIARKPIDGEPAITITSKATKSLWSATRLRVDLCSGWRADPHEGESMAKQIDGDRVGDDSVANDSTSVTPITNPPHPFAHPAEQEFAAFLDFYRIRWQYEPTTFPLRWKDGRVSEMFAPDFYLPEQDLYVELTTMKQSLVTRKNRKMREVRELYPDVNVILIYRKNYHELLSRFGYGSVDITSLRPDQIEQVLLSAAEIQERVNELGREISRDYAGRSIVVVGVLKGITFFLADLARAITRPLVIEYLQLSHDVEQGSVQLSTDLNIDITGQHILLVEDIVNTGVSMDFVLRTLRERNPASLRVCTLLDKAERRLVPVDVGYVGFTIPNEFVVGYGLDYRELYRNLPFICVLKRDVYEVNQPMLDTSGEILTGSSH